MSFGFRSGTDPIRTNPRWVLWFKRAQQLSNRDANAPKQHNTRRQLIYKALKSLNNL